MEIFWRSLYVLVVVVFSLMISFFVCMFSFLSFWWMLIIIPIDAWVIWHRFHEWAKEKAAEEKKEVAYYKAVSERD